MTSSDVHVLNLAGSENRPSVRRPPSAVALELQKTMLQLKGQYMSGDGREVQYSGLRESQLFSEYERVARELANCDLRDLKEEEKKPFFINIYNALTVHGLSRCHPLPASVLELDQFWTQTAYSIGGHVFSLDDIEHGVLRGNRPHPSAQKPPFSDSDPRKQYALSSCDPRIHFALVCGAKSCPAIQVYSPSNIERALSLAASSFCSQEVEVEEEERVVTTSKIFHWYSRDFGSTTREILQWICQFLSGDTRSKLERLLGNQEPIRFEAKEYNWLLNQPPTSAL